MLRILLLYTTRLNVKLVVLSRRCLFESDGLLESSHDSEAQLFAKRKCNDL